MPKPHQTTVLRDFIDLSFCVLGIYFAYGIYTLLQEKITKEKQEDGTKFTFSMFLVCFQSFINAMFSLAFMTATEQPKSNVPHLAYAKIGTSYVMAMWFSTHALKYVGTITQILAKSCKMIPVMLMRILQLDHQYAIAEYVHVLLLTAGICLFTLFSPEGSKTGMTTTLTGMGMLFTSLILDGYTGPTQEKVIKQYNPSQQQMMFYLNFYAVALVLPLIMLTGELFEAVTYLQEHRNCLRDILGYSALSAIGQNFILYTVFRFNSLASTIITTTRKFFSILLSCLVFGHSLATSQWLGVFLVFLALSLNIHFKYYEKMESQKEGFKVSKTIEKNGIIEILPTKKPVVTKD